MKTTFTRLYLASQRMRAAIFGGVHVESRRHARVM
jgi:hypothetical protein